MDLKRLYQKSFFLPLLIVFTYLCLFVETLKYPGFIKNHFYFGVEIYSTISIALLIFTEFRSKVMNLILIVNSFFLIIISVVYLIFSLIEGSHYTNYVLNNIHFHLDGLVWIVLFSLFIFLSNKFRRDIPVIKGKMGVVFVILASLIILFVTTNLVEVFNMAINRDSYILFHSQDSYDQRMYYQWGIFYQYMVFVKNNTPSDATIVIPPEQGAWLMGTGEPNFVRAFLYPRNIVQGMLTGFDTKFFGPNTFILIAWGQEECKPDPNCHGWPKQDIPAKEIIYKNPNSSGAVEVKENTIYKFENKQYVYGLIEL